MGDGEKTIEETWQALQELLERRIAPVYTTYIVQSKDQADISAMVRVFRVECGDLTHEDTVGSSGDVASKEYDRLMYHQVGLRLERLFGMEQVVPRGIFYASGLEVEGNLLHREYVLVRQEVIDSMIDPDLEKILTLKLAP